MELARAFAAAVRRLPPATRAYAGLCLATLAWASAFITGKIALAEFSALAAGAWRYCIATAILMPFAWHSRRAARFGGAVAPLAVLIVCGGVLYPWLFLAALQRTSATNTSLLIALNPVITLLLAPLVGESYDRRRLGGVLLALVGAATVISGGQAAVLADLTAAKSGDLLALAAAGVWASFNLASRGVVAHLPYALTNTLVYGLGGIALFALAAPEHPVRQLGAASPTAVAALAAMAVLSSALAGQLFLYGVHVVGIARTVVFIYMIPVLTALSAALFLGEPLVAAQAVGGAAVLAGVYGTTRPMREPSHAPARAAVRAAGRDA